MNRIRNYFFVVLIVIGCQFKASGIIEKSQDSMQSCIVEPRQQFFESIMGLPEYRFLNLKDEQLKQIIKFLPERNVFLLKNPKTMQEYQAGYFEQISLRELRERASSIQLQGGGTFHVVAAQQTALRPEVAGFVDVAALQADPQNRDAVFQVASNFSALEPVSVHNYPEDGITDYIYDRTQGPAAALSAAPAVIWRQYFMFYDPNTNAITWRQTRKHQINFLDKVADYFPVINGYVALTRESLEKTVPAKVVEDIKVGLHRDAQVTFGQQMGNNHCRVEDPQQIVHQVFTAGLDLGTASGSTNYKFLSSEHRAEVERRAQMLLDAAYESTIKIAAAFGKKKVFLTLVGGGVFNNDLSWIAQALAKNSDFIKQSGLEVYLVIYDYSSLQQKQGYKEFDATVKQLVKETLGSFTIY
jgi:hypothetical protein